MNTTNEAIKLKIQPGAELTIECTHKLKLSGNKLQNCNLKILNLVDIL